MTYVPTARFRKGRGRGMTGLGWTPLGATDLLTRCKDEPVYKDCKAQCIAVGKAQCNSDIPATYPDARAACIQERTLQCAYDCLPSCLKVLPPEEGSPCNDPSVIKFVQAVIGTYADGKWGTNSQTAYEKHLAAGGLQYVDLAYGCTGPSPATEPSVVSPPVVVAPIPLPPPVEVAPPPAKPGVITANMLVGGAVVAALGVGGYLYAKKKGLIG